MKKYFRLFLINIFALFTIAKILPGVGYTGGHQTILITALVLTLVNSLVKPLINLLLLPINLITLGAFRWLINVVSLWLVTIMVPQFKITSSFFPGFFYQGFTIPPVSLGTFWVFVIASFLISLISTFLLWLAK